MVRFLYFQHAIFHRNVHHLLIVYELQNLFFCLVLYAVSIIAFCLVTLQLCINKLCMLKWHNVSSVFNQKNIMHWFKRKCNFRKVTFLLYQFHFEKLNFQLSFRNLQDQGCMAGQIFFYIYNHKKINIVINTMVSLLCSVDSTTNVTV